MEKIKELKRAIGAKPFELLVEAIDKGSITKKVLKKMAIQMGVHGVFMSYQYESDVLDIFGPMMDRWFDNTLFKDGVKGFDLLINILEDDSVRQGELAQKMKQNTEKLFIGLPEKHPHVDLPPQGQSATGTLSCPSNQIGETCASNALGMAALEILHDHGYDADQQKIIDGLVNAFQQNRNPKNPDEFHMKKIKVEIAKQGDPKIRGEIEVEFGIKTQFAAPDSSLAFKTVPNLANLGEKMKMVIRWDTGHGLHAIYAKDYDAKTGIYSCVNSWGDQDSRPPIHHSRIYAVDYVSLVQKK